VHRRKTHRWPASATMLVAAATVVAALAACTPGGATAAAPEVAAGSVSATAGAAGLASSAPASTAPDSTAPDSTAPASTAPASTALTSTAPASTAPAATMSPTALGHPAPGSSTSSPAGTPAQPAPFTQPLPPAQPVLASGARRVTFVNHLSQEIWVAASPDTTDPLSATGWALPPGQSVTVTVPNTYNGRFWGRTGCVFHGDTGHCQTGDCDGKFQCTGWGTIPATLAEYNLDAWDNLDFYDISLVDGSNVPMYAYPTSGDAPNKVSPDGCIAAGCTTAVPCPQALQITAAGKVVACESPCAKLGGDQYCCRGQWAPRAMCDPAKWPVDYAAIFKKAEPYAYSYVDDDATSVYTCKGTCNYNIVFGVTPGG
jgi:hypothetical protein